MWLGILFYLAGTVMGLVALVGVVIFLLSIGGWVGVDGLVSMSEGRADLTCWHCGEQTTSGARHCQHCGKELQ